MDRSRGSRDQNMAYFGFLSYFRGIWNTKSSFCDSGTFRFLLLFELPLVLKLLRGVDCLHNIVKGMSQTLNRLLFALLKQISCRKLLFLLNLGFFLVPFLAVRAFRGRSLLGSQRCLRLTDNRIKVFLDSIDAVTGAQAARVDLVLLAFASSHGSLSS